MLKTYFSNTFEIHLLDKLVTHGFAAYFVGGVIRDLLCGRHNSDIDIATSATPDQVEKIFADEYKTDFVGKSFGVSLVNNVEIATFRKERYNIPGKPEVEFTTLPEDLNRRDFTINAMAYDPINDLLIDPHGGAQDLVNGIIRFVGNPLERILEDPVRILRGFRFSTMLDGEIEETSSRAIKDFLMTERENGDRFSIFSLVPAERIRIEILKTMKIKHASTFFYLLQKYNLLEDIFPSLSMCWEMSHGRHHDEDIFTHCMLCGDFVSIKCPLTKLSGYLHDVGKPMAADVDEKDGELTFKSHDKIGEKLVLGELELLRFSQRESEVISKLVRYHMRPMSNQSSPKSIRKTLSKLREFNLNYMDLLRLRLADHRASTRRWSTDTLMRFNDIKELIEKIEEELMREDVVTDMRLMNINGHDIMETLDIQPGPLVGEILKYLFDMILEDPTLNNREALIHLMKTKYTPL